MSDLVIVKHRPLNAETPPQALAEPVTPSPNVYVRANFGVPPLGAGHRIAVGGAVRAPFEIDMTELREMGSAERLVTMECAGNDRTAMRPLPAGEPWRSGAISTARWTGVPLRRLLERAALSPEAMEVVVTGADGGPRDDAPGEHAFARSLPLSEAMRPDVLLALDMNGEPIAPEHGAPARLVVPGWYGMASVKWVSRIDVLAEGFRGYFQTRRYVYQVREGTTPVTRMRVKSTIVSPRDDEIVARRRTTVWGWAWSGEGEITRVEVAVGGGDSWRDARLAPPASPHAWTRWELEWEPRDAGRTALRSRATDAAGNTQPDEAPFNLLGYGNNGVKTVVVDVL